MTFFLWQTKPVLCFGIMGQHFLDGDREVMKLKIYIYKIQTIFSNII